MTELEQIDLRAIYGELDKAEAGPGQVSRRVFQSTTANFVAYVNTESGLRGARLEFRNQTQAMGSIDHVRGLNILVSSPVAEEEHLTVEQIRPGDSELFAVVMENVVRSFGSFFGSEARTTAERISRWRAFFSKTTDGLSREEQLGLFAELLVLRKIAVGADGFERAVQLWEGPHSEVHDFSADNWALEVKATASRGSSTATISSEVQLDPSVVSPLFLIFFVFDVRPHSTGMSLPQAVRRLRQDMSGSPMASEHFEDLLIDAGYLDIHSRLYVSHYEVTREETFEVSDDFPSVRQNQLPEAVSRTKYSLNVDQCQKWRVSSDALVVSLVAGAA